MKNQLSHFCLHVKDMDKAIAFYNGTLGFGILEQTPQWTELKLNEKVNLALKCVTDPVPGIGFSVDNCEEATKALESKGVKINTRCEKRADNQIILTQFEDPTGNVLWMSERIQ